LTEIPATAPLTIIFRSSMRERNMPADWKKAIVAPILKKR
jgi:hypothetical protein